MIKWVELNQHALELYGSESVRSAEWESSFPSANPITWHAHPPDSISADTFTLVICCLRSADQRMTNDPRRKASHRLVLSENERLYGTQIKLISFRCQRTQLARPASAAPLLLWHCFRVTYFMAAVLSHPSPPDCPLGGGGCVGAS